MAYGAACGRSRCSSSQGSSSRSSPYCAGATPSEAGLGARGKAKEARGAEPSQGAGRSCPVQYRLRQRRLLDLLRPRRRRGVGHGSHAGRVHAHRAPVRHDRVLVCRSDDDVPRSGRFVELCPPHLQRADQLQRRLGADARLHHHHRHLGVLRAQLPRRILADPQDLAVQLHRRHPHHRLPRHHQHLRHQGGGAPQRHSRDPRPGHAGAARHRRAFRLPLAQDPHHADPSGHRADLAPAHLRHLDRHRGLHRHRDDLQHGGGVVQPRPRRAPGGEARPRRRARCVLRDLDGRPLGDDRPLQRPAGGPADEDDAARPRAAGAGQDGGDRAVGVQERPEAARLRPCGQEQHQQPVRSTPTRATGAVYQQNGQMGHQALGDAAGQRVRGGPAAGHRAEPARQARLDEGRPLALDRHPGGDDPDHRHQRRHHRRVTARLLHGGAQAAAAHSQPRASQAFHALRVHRAVRDDRGHTRGARAVSPRSPTSTRSAP